MRVETKAQWQRHSLIEVSDTGTSLSGAPLEGTAVDLLLSTLAVGVLAHHTVGTRVRGTLGASGFYQTNDTRGRIPLVPDARARSAAVFAFEEAGLGRVSVLAGGRVDRRRLTADSKDRKSTRLNSSHSQISYAVFCLKKKKQAGPPQRTPATR